MRHFDVSDGLAHSTVFRVMPSPDSLCIWFGTDRGLSRFDGTNWKNFALPGKEHASYVLAIAPTSHNNIEFGVYNETWTALKGNEIVPKPLHMASGEPLLQVLSVFDDSFGGRWVVDKTQGLFHFGEDGKLLHSLPEEKYAFSKTPSPITQFKGDVLIPYSRGLLAFDGNRFYPFLDSMTVTQVIAQGNQLWMCTPNQLLKWENKELHAVFESANFRSLFLDSRNHLWLATDDGIFIHKNGTVSNMSSALNLEGILVNQMAEDHTGNVWLGTYSSGVFALSPDPVVQLISIVDKTSHVFSTFYKDDKGNVWVGSMNSAGLLKNDSLHSLFNSQEIEGLVSHFHNEEDGSLFIGTASSSYVYNHKTLQKTGYGDVLDYRSDPQEGEIFVGFQGLKIPPNQTFKYPTPCPTRTIRVILPFEKELLVGSRCGIWKVKARALSVWNQPSELKETTVHDLLVIEQNRLMVASSSGLFSFHEGEWEKYQTVSGEDHLIHCLLQTQNGTLLAGTENGLFTLNDARQLEPFPIVGLGKTKVIYSLLELDSNSILCGSLDYLAKVDIGIAVAPSYLPRVMIEEVKVGEDLTKPENQVLDLEKHPLVIRFKAIDFEEHVEFRYWFQLRRNGVLYTQEDNVSQTLFFHRLKPGNYELRIGLMGRSCEEAKLQFGVKDYWWSSPWILIGAIVFLSLFGFGAYKAGTIIRERRQSKKRKRMMQIVDLRHKALNAMMNPHFIFNALNSIQHYVSNNERKKSEDYSNAFAQLIRMNLEQAHSSLVPISEEIERLELYCSLEKLRFKKPFELLIENKENIDLEDVEIPPLMLQPFVENAILHGILPSERKGLIQLQFSLKSETLLRVTITDNGIGVNRDKEEKSSHSSLAIQLIKERLLLQGTEMELEIMDLSDSNPNESGTRVSFCLLV